MCDQGPADELIMLGLRTLELWFDSINPEYMEAAMAEVCELSVGGRRQDCMGATNVTNPPRHWVSPSPFSYVFAHFPHLCRLWASSWARCGAC